MLRTEITAVGKTTAATAAFNRREFIKTEIGVIKETAAFRVRNITVYQDSAAAFIARVNAISEATATLINASNSVSNVNVTAIAAVSAETAAIGS